MALNFLLFYEWVVVLCVRKTLERFLLCSMLICFLGCSQVYGTIVVGDVVNTEAENSIEKHTVKTTFGEIGEIENEILSDLTPSDGEVFREDTWDSDENYSYVMYESEVSSNVVDKLHGYLNVVPQAVIDKILEYDFSIVITNSLIEYGENGMDYVLGLLSPGDRCIYVSQQNIRGVVHELGHCFDYYVVSIEGRHRSNTDEWKDLYKREGAFVGALDMQSMNNVYNETECFAEAFSHYVLGKDYSDMAPQIYQYMDDLVGEYLD